WDAPLRGEAFAMPPIPGPDVLDLRVETTKAAAVRSPGGSPWGTVPGLSGPDRAEQALGSNNWAVAGTHTADGGALVAGDMHLGIGVPNTWYRASIEWPVEGKSHRITGVTLPGAPAMVAGSTGDVAWAFTNTEGD